MLEVPREDITCQVAYEKGLVACYITLALTQHAQTVYNMDPKHVYKCQGGNKWGQKTDCEKRISTHWH
jgi:hypothetical protein